MCADRTRQGWYDLRLIVDERQSERSILGSLIRQFEYRTWSLHCDVHICTTDWSTDYFPLDMVVPAVRLCRSLHRATYRKLYHIWIVFCCV